MAIGALAHAWRNLILSIKTSYRFLYNHSIILGAVFLLLILYRLVPSVFNFIFSYVFRFIISSSPILLCTLVLLQFLFSFRSSDSHQAEEKRRETASLNARKIEDYNLSGINKRRNVTEKAIGNADVVVGDKAVPSSRERKVTFSASSGDDLIDRSVTIEEQLKQARAVSNAGRDVKDQSTGESCSVPAAPMQENGDTLFDSDCAECSSPDNTDVVPVLDEIDPLLDCKPPPPTLQDESDANSISSDRSIDGSADSDNREEALGAGEDGTKAVVSWTEDDQKNLMDLGTSELERNQRLENLIARRRAKKIYGKMAEKNLIDFDSSDIPPQIPTISTAKSNPFDLPYNSVDIEGLPPIPGSAPPVLVPRKNPFDIPYDPMEERPNLTADSFQQEMMSSLQKDMFFCRHESFSWGNSFMGVQQEKHTAKSGPFFDRMLSEGNLYSRFGDIGERSDFRLDSVPEAETPSSVASQEYSEKLSSKFHEEFGEKSESKLDIVPESEPLSPVLDGEHLKKQTEQEPTQGMISSSDRSDEADLVESAQQENRGVEVNHYGREEQESTQGMISESEHSDVIDMVEADQEGHRSALLNNEGREEPSLPEASHNFMKPDVVEENYEGSSSSSSSGTDGERSRTHTEDFHSKDVEQTKGECSNAPSSSSQPSLTVKFRDIKTGAAEGQADDQPYEPVYDSSPSAVEKRTIEESVFYVDKGVLTSSSSIASDMHVEVSEAGSPRSLIERSFSYTEEGEASFRSAHSPCDDYDEDYETRSMQLTENSKNDDVKVGVPGSKPDTLNSISAPVEPESAAEQAPINQKSTPSPI